MEHLTKNRNTALLAILVFSSSNLFAQWSGTNPMITTSNVNIQSPGNDASLDVGGMGDSATVQITTPSLMTGSFVGPFRIRGTNTILYGPPTWGSSSTYFPLFCVKPNGFVGLKTENPIEMLTLNGGNAIALNGNIIARNGSLRTQNSSGTTNFKVDASGLLVARQIDVHLDPIPDFVFHAAFDKDSASHYESIGLYKKMNLNELDSFVQVNRHLPGIKSSTEYQQTGSINLGALELQLLQKIEELTLYSIQLNKELDEIKKRQLELEQDKKIFK